MRNLKTRIESARHYFTELYRDFREGRVLYSDAVYKIPLAMLRFATGTPGRIGYVLGRQMRAINQDAKDAIPPEQTIESLALTVISMAKEARAADDPRLEAVVEYQWAVLRGIILVGFAAARRRYWMKQLALRKNAVELVVEALTVGEQYNKNCWQHDAWERCATTEQIIEWFRLCMVPDSPNA